MRAATPPPPDVPFHGPFVAKFMNLDYRTTEEDFASLFENGFRIVELKMPKDIETNRSRGFAFVEFEDRDSLIKALQMDGHTFQGRNLRSMLAEQRSNRPPFARRELPPDESRDFDNWDRRGPLPPLDHDRPPFPRRDHHFEGPERNFDNWERRGPPPHMMDHDRPPFPRRDHFDGPERNFDNWERRGPPPPRHGDRPPFGFHSGPPMDDERDYDSGFRSNRAPRPMEPEDHRDYDSGFRSNRAPRPIEPEDNRDYDHWERRGPLPPLDRDRRRSRNRRRGSFLQEDPRLREPTEEEKAVDSVDNWRTADAKPLHNFEKPRHRGPAPPKGPPKLNLAPRTKLLEDNSASAPAPSSKSLFGAAKPVDTNKVFLEMEERETKRHNQRLEREKKRQLRDEAKSKEKKNKEAAEKTSTEEKEAGATEETSAEEKSSVDVAADALESLGINKDDAGANPKSSKPPREPRVALKPRNDQDDKTMSDWRKPAPKKPTILHRKNMTPPTAPAAHREAALKNKKKSPPAQHAAEAEVSKEITTNVEVQETTQE